VRTKRTAIARAAVDTPAAAAASLDWNQAHDPRVYRPSVLCCGDKLREPPRLAGVLGRPSRNRSQTLTAGFGWWCPM